MGTVEIRLPVILSLLGGSLELAVALPENIKPPTEPDAAILTIFSLVILFSATLLYSSKRLRWLWGTLIIAMSLALILIGSPLEGFEVLGPPAALTGGILALLAEITVQPGCSRND